MAGRHAKPRRSHVGPIASAAVVASVLVGGVAGAAHLAPAWTGANAPTATTTTAEPSPSSTPPPPAATPTAAAGPTAAPSPGAVKPSATRPPAAASPESSRAQQRASRDKPRSAAPSPSASKPPPRATTTGACGASYYDQGQTTANGERFDPEALTAAHKTLAFNTRVRVTNPGNGKSVEVRINDRGPYAGDRCLDLSRGAFRAIASLAVGELTVEYEVVGR